MPSFSVFFFGWLVVGFLGAMNNGDGGVLLEHFNREGSGEANRSKIQLKSEKSKRKRGGTGGLKPILTSLTQAMGSGKNTTQPVAAA